MTKRIMRKFRLTEISGCARPAQPPAQAVIMKSTKFTKKVCMTTNNKGHAHLIWDEDNAEGGGTTSYSEMSPDKGGHSHPWVRDTQGNIVIGEAYGHSHDALDVTYLEKSQDDPRDGDTSMDPKELETIKKSLDQATGEIAVLKTANARLSAINALTTEEQTFFKSIPDAAKQDAFLKLDANGRKAEIAKAQDSDPVIYTALDGSLFRKSDDPRLVSQAKKNDDLTVRLAKSEAEAEFAGFRKSAEDILKSVPGTIDDKALLLQIITKHAPKDRHDAMHAMLKAHDSGLAKATERNGIGGITDPSKSGTADEKIRKIAKAIQERDPKMTEAQAYDAALRTDEGRAAYAEQGAR